MGYMPLCCILGVVKMYKTVLLFVSFFLSINVSAQPNMDFGAFNELPEFEGFSMPVVLTATRIQQHQADVPASVTILDADLIKQLGVTSLSELFRYVPGMMVGPDSNNNSDAVHYHGGPAAFPKNLQVLVNGRSMYRSVVAAVSWFEMPVALEDIRRIEIVRGPNAASYGSNAFQAIINILTKHPADTYGSTVSVKKGNNGDQNIYLKEGGIIGNTDYRVSFNKKTDGGFENERDHRIAKFIDIETHRQLDSQAELEASIVYLHATKELADQVTYQTNQNEVDENRLELGVRWTRDYSQKHQVQVKVYATQYNQRQTIEVAEVEVSYLDDSLRELYKLNSSAVDGESMQVATTTAKIEEALGAGDPSIFTGYYSALNSKDKNNIGLLNMYKLADVFTSVGMEATGLLLVGDYIASLPASQQILANSYNIRYPNSTNAKTPVNGTINADIDEYRFDVEIQDTYIYSPKLTLVSGVSVRRDAADSQSYLGGRITNNTARVFGSATWKATSAINLHLGLMLEKESEADSVYAPRVALNYKLTPSQSLRAVYSESVRSPDMFEQNANWTYTLDGATSDAPLNGTTFYLNQQGPNTLEHQFIESYEIGYYGKLALLDLESDVRIFHENLTDVYYQTLRLGEFSTEKNIKIRFEGIEWMLNVTPWEKGRIRWNAALVSAFSNTETLREISLLRIYAQTTTTLSWLQEWPWQVNSTFTYMKADKMNQLTEIESNRSLIERIDGRLAKFIKISNHEVEVSAGFQHDLSSDSYVQIQNFYEDKTRIQLGLSLSF
jgi:iron complex outermembrane receptor protein